MIDEYETSLSNPPAQMSLTISAPGRLSDRAAAGSQRYGRKQLQGASHDIPRLVVLPRLPHVFIWKAPLDPVLLVCDTRFGNESLPQRALGNTCAGPCKLHGLLSVLGRSAVPQVAPAVFGLRAFG